MSEASGQEKRRYRRSKLVLPIELRRENQKFGIRGETADLSLSGFYFHTMLQMPIGTVQQVKLWIGDQALECAAVVRTADLAVGNGFEFIDMPEPVREALEKHLASFSETEEEEL